MGKYSTVQETKNKQLKKLKQILTSEKQKVVQERPCNRVHYIAQK